MKLIWKTELVVFVKRKLFFLVSIITFIVSSKFHNLLLLEGKWFTSYYLTRHMVLFIQQIRNKRKHARHCSIISVSSVLYFTKCAMVWCGVYHIKTYQIKLQIIFDLRIIQKQEQDLIIWKDPVFNYIDFFISDAYARHKSVISGKLKSIL